jgi:hypothetical protein
MTPALTAFDRRAAERAAVDHNGTLPVDDQTVADANKLLSLLAAQAKESPDWKAVLNSCLPAERVEQTIRTVEQRKDQFQFDHDPIGGIPTGTGVVREAAGLVGERGQIVIQLLKVTGRLVQGGPGRGKCLVVIDDSPLDPATFPQTIATRPARDLDLLALLELVRQGVINEREQMESAVEAALEEARKGDGERVDKLAKELQDLATERARLTREVTELQGQLGTKEETIQSLERKLAERMVSSWM